MESHGRKTGNNSVKLRGGGTRAHQEACTGAHSDTRERSRANWQSQKSRAPSGRTEEIHAKESLISGEMGTGSSTGKWAEDALRTWSR